MSSLKQRLTEYYEKNDVKVDIGFFLGGFIFDVLTLADIDDPLSIAQQLIYFLLIGSVLYYNFLFNAGIDRIPKWLSKVWKFRDLILHFFLGSLLSVYSLFFLKSSSFASSFVFVLILMGLMVANELKVVQKRGDLKIALGLICLFSFYSMMFPLMLGFVGVLPFVLALIFTAFSVFGIYRLLQRHITDQKVLTRGLTQPGLAVIALFAVFYFVGWIPPVPLSVQNMGVYHDIEKREGQYILSHEKPSWKFWQTGDQDFRAEPGDKIFIFAQIFSPGRFDDSVILHWFFNDPRRGWVSTDKVSMRVTGGRKNGYRGFSVKQNYTPGDWRVKVETTDGREIGRLTFEVTSGEPRADRVFEKSVY